MDFLSVLLHQRTRRFGPQYGNGVVIPDVSIREEHSDSMQITDHPVENPTSGSGAGMMSDHAFRMPAVLRMDVGFSGNGSLLDLIDTTTFASTGQATPKEVYDNLLQMQRSKEPLTITTGKRRYYNMLIQSLNVVTDEETENVLRASITFREIITTTSFATGVPRQADMQDGVSTSGTQNTGLKSPVAIENATELF
ncbi:hypothetical protein R84981_002819 [Carnimonas sp. R-84981]|uniref:phage baseplate protein n=1 Tax=Carnimonas bestiolae TaxID=3402172 RepID=UPI003EDBA2A1